MMYLISQGDTVKGEASLLKEICEGWGQRSGTLEVTININSKEKIILLILELAIISNNE